MTNKEIASQFRLLGKLMELHNENAFKIRSYTNAYLNIRKLPESLDKMTGEEIESLPGIGKAISSKINELLETGELKNINKYLEITPPGIVEMLDVKGLGAKKILVIWKELEIESIGELLYAINENRLIELKGFGEKTQKSIKEQLEYFVESADKQLYARIVDEATELLKEMKGSFNTDLSSFCGALHQKNPIISKLEFITTVDKSDIENLLNNSSLVSRDQDYRVNGIPLEVIYTDKANFYIDLVHNSSDADFLKALDTQIPRGSYQSEEEVFENNNIPFYIPEFREKENIEYIAHYQGADSIITLEELRGCIHNHSTWSDGVNSLEEMLKACIDRSWEYFVITDHSKSAFYANGLQEERLIQQIDEISKLDQEYSDIRFFSGIESDILSNGDLDYPDELLSELDLVVASVHSNLKMDIDKATTRIIKAVENPFTSILGHPTGRLLLSRKAYPLDFKKVIDACAANNVAIEINANPLRLDLDWSHVQYAMSRNVLISINPDAHSIKGLDDSYYGVCAARKGGLTQSYCLNAFDLDEFEEWLGEQHAKRP